MMRPRRWAGAIGAAARRRRGLTGFLAGTAFGVAVAVLVGVAVPRLLPDGEEFETGSDLRVYSGADESATKQRKELIDQWNKLGGGRPHAVLVEVKGDADTQRAAMVRQAQGGGADVDIYNLDVTLMAEFVDNDYLKPLDDSQIRLDKFLDNPRRTCERKGKLWCLPFNTDAGLLFYRSDLINKLVKQGASIEPPSSWQALVGDVQDVFALRDADHPGLEAGYTGQFADYEGLSVNAFEAIWAAGGDVVDDSGKVVIDSPEAKEGLRRLADGLQGKNPRVILDGSLSFREGEATQAFRDGKVIFMRNWPVHYQTLVSTETPAKPVEFGVARIPGRSVLGGQNLAIAAGSDQPRAAQDLIEFLTSERSQQILFERGGFAATRELIYHDPGVKDEYQYAETLLSAVKQAKRRPDTQYYAKFSEVFRKEVLYALSHDGELQPGAVARLSDALHGVVS